MNPKNEKTTQIATDPKTPPTRKRKGGAKMKRAKWKEHHDKHLATIEQLERSGEILRIYRTDKQRSRKLYQRLGYLKQKVESLSESEVQP